ncbi:hypothetical protein D9M69_617750 [compost metagenome]
MMARASVVKKRPTTLSALGSGRPAARPKSSTSSMAKASASPLSTMVTACWWSSASSIRNLRKRSRSIRRKAASGVVLRVDTTVLRAG